jgi:hypothetical protein
MRRRSWWKWSLYPVLLTLTLLCGAVSAHAQSLSDDSDDGDQDAKPIPAASLSVVFAEDGHRPGEFLCKRASEQRTGDQIHA